MICLKAAKLLNKPIIGETALEKKSDCLCMVLFLWHGEKDKTRSLFFAFMDAQMSEIDSPFTNIILQTFARAGDFFMATLS